MPVSKSVGARIKRREDPRLIQGLAQYVDDIQLPGTLHVAVVRSPYGHAHIQGIDTAAAADHPGVVAVVTGDDLQGNIGTIPCATTDPEGFPGIQVPDHPVLAHGKVRFVGEPVVAVVADSPYTASDAAELVEVDYEPLDAVNLRGGRVERWRTPSARGIRKQSGLYLGHCGRRHRRCFRPGRPRGQTALQPPAPGAEPDGDTGRGRAVFSRATVNSLSGPPHRSRTCSKPSSRLFSTGRNSSCRLSRPRWAAVSAAS